MELNNEGIGMTYSLSLPITLAVVSSTIGLGPGTGELPVGEYVVEIQHGSNGEYVQCGTLNVIYP